MEHEARSRPVRVGQRQAFNGCLLCLLSLFRLFGLLGLFCPTRSDRREGVLQSNILNNTASSSRHGD
jgi:hypothetical protein